MPKASVQGINLYYEVHGSGYPLILIRGLGRFSADEKGIPFYVGEQFFVGTFKKRPIKNIRRRSSPPFPDQLGMERKIFLDNSSNDEYKWRRDFLGGEESCPLLPPFIVPGTRNLLIITGAWRTILRPLFRSTRSGSKGRTGSGAPTSRRSLTATWTVATCTTALPG